MIPWIKYFFTRQWWTFTGVWLKYGGWRHRCQCCNAYNRSVGNWSNKFGRDVWFCGECIYLCDGHCNGVPFRRLERR